MSHGSRQFLSMVWSDLKSGRVHGGMEALFDGLRDVHARLTRQEWDAFREQAREHSLCKVLRTDPLTDHAFRRPRGYPGDAGLLDMIYDGVRVDYPHREGTSALGERIFSYLVASPAAHAVRSRRRVLAGMVDETPEMVDRPRVLSVAAGHLREAELSSAVRTGRIGEYVALDQDGDSLAVIEERHAGDPSIKTVQAGARELVAGRLDLGSFDLIYSAGLFDYLSARFARQLVARLFERLAPGGRLVVFNFAPDLRDVGFMETFLRWDLIYRTESDMEDLVCEVPADARGGVCVRRDPSGALVYFDLARQAEPQSDLVLAG